MDLDPPPRLSVRNGSQSFPFGVGGPGGRAAAPTPNLAARARESACGFTLPVAPGVTPGSGPGHLSLFGYDPLKFNIGRGALEAVGIDFDLRPRDIAARGNFCTVDGGGAISDRRAGRISNERCAELCAKLRGIRLDGVGRFVGPGRGPRFVFVL